MNRLRRWSAWMCFLIPAVLLFSVVRGQEPGRGKKADEKPKKEWLFDRSLTVSPATAPVPALKYRFYPTISERKDGNAVPIYLRFAHERSDARKKTLREKPIEWNKLPLDTLPLEEVKKFLDDYKYNLKQLELGARRKHADWNYTLDAGDPIGLLLPDAQEMRMHAPILVLKARVEILEGRYKDAVRTLETGFSFAQQVGQGPFLINSLVSMAIAHQMTDALVELIERPGSPNLYWALTVLPRPLVDLRNQYELEQVMLEMEFPDLADLDRPRAPEEWDAILKRFRKSLERLSELDKNVPKLIQPGNGSEDAASKSPHLPAARKYLTDVVGMTAAKVEAMPPARALLLYLSNQYHQIRDEFFKATYLPFPQTPKLTAEAEKILKSVKSMPNTEGRLLAYLLLPAIPKVMLSEQRIERKLAMVRAIEALRMHAAAHDGQLPEKLSQVTLVPVPNDPSSGKPFEYHLEGQTATLISRIPGHPQDVVGLRYRLTIKK